jgi:MFS family permease
MGVLVAISLSIVTMIVTVMARDHSLGGPHHDEVIALMAAKGLEIDYRKMSENREPPLHEIASATDWHRFTRNFESLPFTEIRDDVLAMDKHPPLAFWVMNRWLSLSKSWGYDAAVWLMTMLVIAAAAILALTLYRCTGHAGIACMGFIIFSLGNSAIFTACWVRQYSLFVLLYAMVVWSAAEVVRRGISRSHFFFFAALLGLASLLGMLCQYTFATMSGPIHFAVISVFLARREWSRAWLLAASYLIAGTLFFLALPNALQHARAVSSDMAPKWQIVEGLRGLARIAIPLPSSLPVWLQSGLGATMLLLPLILAVWLGTRSTGHDSDLKGREFADVRIPLWGMLGSGVLQFVMVAFGYYPGWATGENHLCAFWLLSVLALCGSFFIAPPWLRNSSFLVLVVGMLGMQSAYIFHANRLLPRINTSYLATTDYTLVCIDNLSRGFVLQITELMEADDSVLVDESSRIAQRLTAGQLPDRILYLPMDETVRRGKEKIIEAAKQSGYRVSELPVVHTGMYEAVLLERPSALESTPSR